ncbi:MAG: type III-A CRISPR-associated RAMP protein Csm5 [Blautia sp.]|nr:type III-A CRISPR-associated RAMP protein Csm5 [Blautia sp.]
MKDYLKAYQAELKVITPVHIGNGVKLNKKEYIFQRNTGKVYVMNIQKMFAGLARKGLQRQFTDYYLQPRSFELDRWLRDNRIGSADYNSWVSYSMEGGGCLADRGRKAEIAVFQKDAYGCPYVPGTAIKGMLRTILMAYELSRNPDLCRNMRQDLPRIARNDRKNRKYYLSGEHKSIEQETFYTLNRQDEKGKPVRPTDAVNDCLSGLIVGDSEPLKTSDLVLCQKLDQKANGEVNKINILRESLKPGCIIRFKVTIDSMICKYTMEDIQKAINIFGDLYYDLFSSHFKDTDRTKPGTVWIGGGTGFATKTVIYPLLGYAPGVMTAMEVFDKTLSQKARSEHRHDRDKSIGISPHMLKCTEYKGKQCQMGMCQMSFTGQES